MASSLAFRCGKVFLDTDEGSRSRLKPRRHQMLRSLCSSAGNFQGRGGGGGNAVKSHVSIYAVTGPFPHSQQVSKAMERKKSDEEHICPDRLDDWMRDSVTEIVRNIGKAPFLLHVYQGDGPSSTKTRMERELAVSEDWPHITRRWKEKSCPKPDGVILVEQLKDDEDGGMVDCRIGNPSSSSWGIVIQGKGLDCAACYILKTSRIGSSVGFCTHFCLVKAKCFGDAAELQLRDSWLQRQ